jgi:hypothetical protein
MDLLSVFRTFRRHWLAALPVLLLTVACLVYVVAVRPTDYEATASVALLTPPSPPKQDSGEDVLVTEAGKTSSPLNRFYDQTVVVNIVSQAISTDTARDALVEQGADSRYEVGPGASGPIADIVAIAPTPEQAIESARLVAEAYTTELQRIQADQGVDPAYMITTLPVESPENAKPKVSSMLRLAIAVVGLGVIATFFVVSLAEARTQLRRERGKGGAKEDAAAEPPDEPEAQPELEEPVDAPAEAERTPPPPPPPVPSGGNRRSQKKDTSKKSDEDDDVSPPSLPERKPWGATEARRPASMPTRPLRGR